MGKGRIAERNVHSKIIDVFAKCVGITQVALSVCQIQRLLRRINGFGKPPGLRKSRSEGA